MDVGGGSGVRLHDGPDLKLFGVGASCLLLGVFLSLQIFSDVVWHPVGTSIHRTAYCIRESSFLIHHNAYHNLFVCP